MIDVFEIKWYNMVVWAKAVYIKLLSITVNNWLHKLMHALGGRKMTQMIIYDNGIIPQGAVFVLREEDKNVVPPDYVLEQYDGTKLIDSIHYDFDKIAGKSPEYLRELLSQYVGNNILYCEKEVVS